MRCSIRQFVAKVEPGLFVRAHRRWLVRKAAILELCARRVGGTEIILRNGRRVPTGRVYLKQLRQMIQASARSPVRGTSTSIQDRFNIRDFPARRAG